MLGEFCRGCAMSEEMTVWHVCSPRPIGGHREACGAWPGFETTRRAKLVARTASGRAGLAPPGSVVAKLPRGSEVGRNSASGGVEVEEGD